MDVKNNVVPIKEKNFFEEACIGYLSIGWSIFPAKQREKIPLVSWERYQEAPPSNETVKKWAKKWPKANIGLATGRASGIIVVDIDSPEGEEYYIHNFGKIPSTIAQKTPNGRHLFFKHPGFICSNSTTLIKDVDIHIRGDGGYVIVPPSIHPEGGRYKWVIDPVEYGLDDLLDCPKNLLALIRDSPNEGGRISKNYEHWVQDALEGVSKGRRNDMCAKLAGYFLRALKGDVSATEKILLDWNERNEPPMNWKEIGQTIRSIHSRQSVEELREESGIEIEHIKDFVYPDGEHLFSVLVRGQEIEMNMDTLANHGKCFNKIAEKTHFIGQVKNKAVWLSLINPILNDAEVIMMSEDETMIGVVREAIKKTMKEDPDLTRINDRPCIKDGDLYVKIGAVMEEMNFGQVSPKHPRELGKILRIIGFKKFRSRDLGDRLKLWKIELAEFEKRD
ncbi:MAG TPA: hypothetical protein ENI02_01080 [Candidatus Aminicenantes bacterium]|nr:hypothetical protein [Candidatus Aminicenantes bacterium]